MECDAARKLLRASDAWEEMAQVKSFYSSCLKVTPSWFPQTKLNSSSGINNLFLCSHGKCEDGVDALRVILGDNLSKTTAAFPAGLQQTQLKLPHAQWPR